VAATTLKNRLANVKFCGARLSRGAYPAGRGEKSSKKVEFCTSEQSKSMQLHKV
jgi:hypothetical protein